MSHKSFGKEWNERAGFVAAIAVINPIILTAYIMFWHRAGGGLEFWLVGMGLTFIVCSAAGLFMLGVIILDRRKRAQAQRRKDMWADVMPYSAARAKAGKSTEAG